MHVFRCYCDHLWQRFPDTDPLAFVAPLWLLRILHDVVHCSGHAKAVVAVPSNLRRLLHSVSALRDDGGGLLVGGRAVWFQSQLVLTSVLRVVLPAAVPSLPVSVLCGDAAVTLPLMNLLCSVAGVGCYALSALATHGVTVDDVEMLEVGGLVGGTAPGGYGIEESKVDQEAERESKDDHGA